MAERSGRFGRTYRAIALHWTNFCILFAVANLVAAGWLATQRDGDFTGWLKSPPRFIREALAQSYPDWNEEDRVALWREHAHLFVPDPLVVYREEPMRGRWVTVDPNGFRVGSNQGPWPPSPDHYNVYLLGGSTAFGYGVRDEDTVSSHLQQMLSAVGGRAPRVYNFGRGGFFSSQERILFEKLAVVGPAPDLAIFLDGVNDFVNAGVRDFVTVALTQATESDLRHPLAPVLRSLPLARALLPSARNVALERQAAARAAASAGVEAPGRPGPASDPERIEAAIETYLANLEASRAVGEGYGIDVAFVWQPAPTYKYDLSHHTWRGKTFQGHELSRDGYQRMRARVDAHPPGEEFLWCADIQEGVAELLYVDKMHYSPDMSERVARCIADGLEARGLPR